MSLISDELRKSAADQGGDPEPPKRGRSGLNRPIASLLLVGAIVIGLLVAAGALFYFAFSPEKEEPAPAEAPVAEPVREDAPPATISAETAGETEAAPVSVSAASEEQAPAAAEQAAERDSGAEAISTTGGSEPFAALEKYMNEMEVSGIRVSDTGKRAIINGRMYAIGDKLPITFELRLAEVAPGQLEFRDANGVIYRKHF